jgi:excisionase family DNA binding protein
MLESDDRGMSFAELEVLTLKELASYLKVSTESLRTLIKRGEIPAARVGNQYRFRKDLIDLWLKTNSFRIFQPGNKLFDDFRIRCLKLMETENLSLEEKDRFNRILYLSLPPSGLEEFSPSTPLSTETEEVEDLQDELL